ncbi:MAG: hypothetical protein U1F15_15260 [Burkholderiales bacterium]
MFYRVVLQGRTLGGADVEEVKRQFVRVTGLPPSVADRLFGGTPEVIKRQVPQTDAERIAATLRAIGAAAVVERELPGAEDATREGVRVVVAPLHNGPPTIIPGGAGPADSAPVASPRARRLRTVREKWPMVAGGIALVAVAILLAPYIDDLVADLRRATSPAPPPAPVAPARTPTAAAAAHAAPLNAALLHGPWRCVDQRTGVSTYWSYADHGTLIFHGDALSDRPAPGAAGASAPTGWKIEGRRLSHTFERGAPVTYTLTDLTLSRLRYGDERGADIECRRP